MNIPMACDESVAGQNTIAHPQVSGRPNRIGVLDRVIGDTKEDGRFWIAGGAEIAKWWRESGASAPTARERLNR